MTQLIGRRRILGIGAPQFALTEFESMKESFDIHWFTPYTHAQVCDEVKRLANEHGPFDVAYVLFNTARYGPCTEEMLAPLLPSLGLFVSGGAGYNHVPVKWLEESGVYAANTPDAVTNATADMATYLTLAVLKNTYQVELNVRAGKWRDGLDLVDDPLGKIFGIFGMGRIAKATAKKVQGLGMNVVYFSRTRLSQKEEQALNVTYMTEDVFLATLDVLSIHCPLNADTENWLSAERIKKMKDGAYVVNTARGPIIDDIALISALQSGKICRAGLDVMTGEPNPNTWYLKSNKVIIQPHWAAFTRGAIHDGECQVLDNIRTYLDTGRPRYPVNTPKLK